MKTNLAVIFGGRSCEHIVSIASAKKAIKHLSKEKFEIFPIYLTMDGRIFTGDVLLEIDNFNKIEDILKKSIPAYFTVKDGKTLLMKQGFFSKKIAEIDVALPTVHGTNVEDGGIQGFLKTLNIPYASPDILASAVGMDKFVSKLLFKEAGLPVLDCIEISRHDYTSVANIAKKIKDEFNFPAIVKPVNTGSSLGISIVKEEENLQAALDEAFRRSNRLIIEPALSNFREINCSVYGDDSTDVAIASECEELKTKNEILSFEDKYQGDQWMAGEHRIFPAELTEREKATIQVAATSAFKALHCSGIARVDFMITDNGKIYINEINTIPGALSAGLWQNPSEMTYEEVLERIIKDAIRRKRTDDQLNYNSGKEIESLSGNFGNKGI